MEVIRHMRGFAALVTVLVMATILAIASIASAYTTIIARQNLSLYFIHQKARVAILPCIGFASRLVRTDTGIPPPSLPRAFPLSLFNEQGKQCSIIAMRYQGNTVFVTVTSEDPVIFITIEATLINRGDGVYVLDSLKRIER